MPPKIKITKNSEAGLGLARVAALAAFEKKASDILIIDLTKIESAPADYFVLCTCNSTTHVQSAASAIETACRIEATQPPRSEGWEALEWVLVDCFDVVVHVMSAAPRDFYKIEKLWGDGKFIHLDEKGSFVAEKPVAEKKAARTKKIEKGDTEE